MKLNHIQYNHYTIYYAGMQTGFPSAIMFDPKGDERKLLPHEYWVQVKDQETVSEIITAVQAGSFVPRLYRILDLRRM